MILMILTSDFKHFMRLNSVKKDLSEVDKEISIFHSIHMTNQILVNHYRIIITLGDQLFFKFLIKLLITQ